MCMCVCLCELAIQMLHFVARSFMLLMSTLCFDKVLFQKTHLRNKIKLENAEKKNENEHGTSTKIVIIKSELCISPNKG